MAVVNTDFLSGDAFAPWYTEGLYDTANRAEYEYAIDSANYAALQSIQQTFGAAYNNASAVQNLTNSECIAAYGTSFVSGRDHVLAVTSARGNQTNQTLFYEDEILYYFNEGTDSPPYDWICMDLSNNYDACDITSARANATNWTLNGRKIEYCLSSVEPSHCKLQFSVYILITVIIMNACKCTTMFLTLWREKEATLVRIRDTEALPPGMCTDYLLFAR